MVHLLIHSHPGVRAGSRVARSRSHNVVTTRGGHGSREDASHGGREGPGRDHPQAQDDPGERDHSDRGQHHRLRDLRLAHGGPQGDWEREHVPYRVGDFRGLFDGELQIKILRAAISDFCLPEAKVKIEFVHCSCTRRTMNLNSLVTHL